MFTIYWQCRTCKEIDHTTEEGVSVVFTWRRVCHECGNDMHIVGAKPHPEEDEQPNDC